MSLLLRIRTALQGLAALVMGLAAPGEVLADWEIDQSAYNSYLCWQVKVTQACAAPARVGRFATRQECEAARTQRHLAGDTQWLSRSRCVGFDRPSAPVARPAPSGGNAAGADGTGTREQARFESRRQELLAKLKGPGEDGRSPPAQGGTETSRALRELECAAYWALVAAHEAAAGGSEAPSAARAAAGRAAGAERVDQTGCPPPPRQGPVPIPQPALETLPPGERSLRELIEQARAVAQRLARHRQTAAELAAERARRERALQQRKANVERQKPGEKDADGQHAAEQALAAVEALERELAALEGKIAQNEAEQRKMLAELDDLDRRYQAITARTKQERENP